LAGKLERIEEKRRIERRRMERLFVHERRLWGSGVNDVAGVDEVGIGPMAGPVVAAAVVFHAGTRIDGVDDSKVLDEDERVRIERAIRERARCIGIGVVDPADVDRLNVYHAGLEAMRRAVVDLGVQPGHVLVDNRTIPGIDAPQSSFVRGDSLSFSIAAASIVAKVYRDRMMSALDAEFPGYGLGRNKGYCTPEHQEAVTRLGPSRVHRRSYTFILELVGEYSEPFYQLRAAVDRVRSAADVRRIEAGIGAMRDRLSGAEKRKLQTLVRRRKARVGTFQS
jgi:ribonuclease HII